MRIPGQISQRWRLALTALGVIGGLSLVPRGLVGQVGTVTGQGVAASVQTLLGSTQVASATLPTSGGFTSADAPQIAVPGTLAASSLTSLTSGMVDNAASSAQTTAEAGGVSILNGLVQAQQVLAVASSWLTGQGAASSAAGSQLTGLVVNGVNFGDVTPAPNTRVQLPGTGYVILNEQSLSGDGSSTTGLVVNMVHVVLVNALGLKTGDVVVGSAASHVSR